jgi:ArsR family transcriptional regulator
MTTTAAPSSTSSPSVDGRRELTVLDACCTPATPASDEAAAVLAGSFKALADPARVKIMSALLNADEVCACDIASVIGKSQATASHHLSILRKAGLITGEKRGTWIYYRAVNDRLAALGAALSVMR